VREWTGLVAVGGLDSFRCFAAGSWAGDPSRSIAAAAAAVGDFSHDSFVGDFTPFFFVWGNKVHLHWNRSQGPVFDLAPAPKLDACRRFVCFFSCSILRCVNFNKEKSSKILEGLSTPDFRFLYMPVKIRTKW
jgi:hypothetical protein